MSWRHMSGPGRIERWLARHGGQIVLILLALSALIQIFRLWRSGAL